MPVFAYKGFDSKGKAVKGKRDADSDRALRRSLKNEGVRVSEISTLKDETTKTREGALSTQVNFKKMFQSVSTNDLALATRQLATLLGAGVDMVSALSALIEQIDNELLKDIFADIKRDVNEGISLADAMKKHKEFDKIYVNMVRAAEHSGTLDVVLERLAEFKEGQARIRSQVVGMLIYPIIMLVMGVLLVGLMFVVVVPKITAVFEHTKSTLPWNTKLLIGATDFASKYWWLVMLFAGICIYAFRRWRRSESGSRKWDAWILNAPMFGEIVRLLGVARFARTLSTLLSSGVPLLSSLEIVKNVVANHTLADAVEFIRDAVREGESIAPPLKQTGQFPPMVNHMVAIGEKSGELEQMLARVANTYEERVEVRTKAIMSAISPLMLVFMASGVGFIMFSILQPIMAMSQMVH